MTKTTAPVKTSVRILGDNAIVPSASGPHCYRVTIRCRVPMSCDCPARRKNSDAPCKHMIAVRAALADVGRTGLDVAEVDLVPQRRKPTPAPTLASLYCTEPPPTWSAAQRAALAARFAEFEASLSGGV